MSILAKYNAAMEAKDEAAMNEILHDDYKFTCLLYTSDAADEP